MFFFAKFFTEKFKMSGSNPYDPQSYLQTPPSDVDENEDGPVELEARESFEEEDVEEDFVHDDDVEDEVGAHAYDVVEEELSASPIPSPLLRTPSFRPTTPVAPPAPRRRVAEKRPRRDLFPNDEEEYPDLSAYFALFAHFSEEEQVKLCRAYANMLAAKNPKNRLRYSKNSGVKWAKKRV